MQTMNVRGAEISYRVIGEVGPWVALTPGGRRGHEEIVRVAEKIAAQGFRIFLHDRRNTGASEFSLTSDPSEETMWADDLAEMLSQLGAEKAFVGGFSSGSRMSMLVSLRHPNRVRGLLLCRVTGGETAARRLPENYYGQFIKAAREGGLDAVLATAQYQERIRATPDNATRLLSFGVDAYIETMTRWYGSFLAGAEFPVMGISPIELSGISAPTIVIPGNDRTHSSDSGKAAAQGIPGATLFDLGLKDEDLDIIQFSDWKPYEVRIADVFVGFMNGVISERAKSGIE